MTSINLGRVEVVAARALGQPPAASRGQMTATPSALSLQDSQRSSGFPILQPGWLPSPDLSLFRVLQLVPVPPSKPARANALHYKGGSGNWLVIMQEPLGEMKGTVTLPFDLGEASLGGHSAAVYTTTIPAQGHANNALNLLNALFEQGEFLMRIHGPGLSVDDIDRIAGSLR